mgnify:CR=1 FL=1
MEGRANDSMACRIEDACVLLRGDVRAKENGELACGVNGES